MSRRRPSAHSCGGRREPSCKCSPPAPRALQAQNCPQDAIAEGARRRPRARPSRGLALRTPPHMQHRAQTPAVPHARAHVHWNTTCPLLCMCASTYTAPHERPSKAREHDAAPEGNRRMGVLAERVLASRSHPPWPGNTSKSMASMGAAHMSHGRRPPALRLPQRLCWRLRSTNGEEQSAHACWAVSPGGPYRWEASQSTTPAPRLDATARRYRAPPRRPQAGTSSMLRRPRRCHDVRRNYGPCLSGSVGRHKDLNPRRAQAQTRAHRRSAREGVDHAPPKRPHRKRGRCRARGRPRALRRHATWCA